jgi:hypothetical protein
MKGGLKLNEALYKEIKTRLGHVTHRLNALEKEYNGLLTEQTHLKELEALYKDMDYDPIEEERRVTSAMLHIAATEEVVPYVGCKAKGRSIYDDPIEAVFTTSQPPLAFWQIVKMLREITGKNEKELTNKNVGQIMKQQIRKGKIQRLEKGFYTWTGDNKIATTSTIPD